MSAASTPTPTPALRRESPWRRNLLEFLSSKTAVFGLVIATLLILAAVLAPWISPQNPYDLLQIDVLDSRMTPGSMNGLGTFHYWLGTDGQGRDLLSGILYGLRISLMVGVGSALIAGIIGTLLGLLAAYAANRPSSVPMMPAIRAEPTPTIRLMRRPYRMPDSRSRPWPSVPSQ